MLGRFHRFSLRSKRRKYSGPIGRITMSSPKVSIMKWNIINRWRDDYVRMGSYFSNSSDYRGNIWV